MPHLQPPAIRAVLLRIGLGMAAIVLVAACASTPTPAPTPAIALGLDDASPSAIRGQSVQITVDLTRTGGADAPVALDVTGLPANVTAAFAPASLAGGVTESTLTLTVGPAASDGAADLTVTGTSGSLSADADLTLTVGSLTINGRVQQGLQQPLIGASVSSQGETAVTDATGAFTLSGLSVPYDLLISSSLGDGGLHVYEGMTSEMPLLRPTFGVDGSATPDFGATIDGVLVGGALAADERVVVCLEGIAIAVFGCDFLDAGDAAYSIAAGWFDTAAVGVRLHALHTVVDADDVPTAYLGYETILLNLADGAVTLADLDFDPIDDGTLIGTTSHPVALPDTNLLVFARFGPNLSLPIISAQDTADAFELLVPVLPGLSYDVIFQGSSTDEFVLTWKHDVGLDAGELAVALPALPVEPADATTGVDLTTPFSSTAAGGARTYVWEPDPTGIVFGLTTTRTDVTLPDPAESELTLPAGADYAWVIVGHGADDVDTAAAGGFADFFQLLFAAFGSAGPGFDGDRTLSLSSSRDFTFAP